MIVETSFQKIQKLPTPILIPNESGVPKHALTAVDEQLTVLQASLRMADLSAAKTLERARLSVLNQTRNVRHMLTSLKSVLQRGISFVSVCRLL